MDNKESIYPSFIEVNDFRYIKVDDKYISNIVIYDFPTFNTFLSIIEDIPKDTEYTMSMYIQKQDSYKVLKELTYSISTSKSELKTSSSSQVDIDIINKLKDDANSLRKEIQINNQEIFYVNFILTFYSQEKQNLFKQLKYFQSRLYSKQLYSKITNFRHMDEYVLSLPLNKKESFLLKQNFRNFTTNSLGNVFPFYTKNIFDIDGIIFGKIVSQNKLCSIDIFKHNYLNGNMCILGSSGAGKSFFAKLLIIRHFINKKFQYIFDIEGEYSKLVESLNGEVFRFDKNHINILQFFNYEVNNKKNDFYDNKINNILQLIKEIYNIEDLEIFNDFHQAIIKVYEEFGISKNIETLYRSNQDKIYLNKTLKKNNEFPKFNNIAKKLMLNRSKKIANCFESQFPYFCGLTDIDLDNKLVSFDISIVKLDKSQIALKYILDNIINKVKNEISFKSNTIIYFDEVWKYMLYSKDSILSSCIFQLFKTIRKFNASIIVITQDITDIFSDQNLSFGKSILNNCFFKVMFRLDFKDVKVLKEISGINNEILEKISFLNKGQCTFLFNNNIMQLSIEASNYEKELIEGE